MKKKILTFCILVTLLLSCNQSRKEPENDKLNSMIEEIFENYYQEYLKLFPLTATYAGDYRYNHLLPNFLSEDFRKKETEFYEKYLSKLADYRINQLNDNNKLSYEMLKRNCELALQGLKYPFHLMPIDQFWTMQLTIGTFAAGKGAQPFNSVKDYEDWLKRLDGYIAWCDTAIANMKKGIETGYVLPKALIKKIIPQVADLDHGPVEDHLYYRPLLNIPDSIGENDKDSIAEKYKSYIGDKIIPVYQRLNNFLVKEYLPAGRESSGYSALPKGKEMYDFMVKSYTTTDISADEIFRIGHSEVKRITEEMEKVKNSVGFEGDILSFFNFVRTNRDLMPFKTADDVIGNFKSVYETMKPKLELMFNTVPKTPFEIRRVEAFREKSSSAHYSQGSLDGKRPGIFYVPVPDPEKYNTFSDESLFLHEAIPGHHFQISLQQENENLPSFRRTDFISAYGEGWALYCESLGKDLGLYTDPYQYFGMLSAEIHRAIRLVVDVGIHAKGWTREQAINYSLEHEAESESSIVSEIERYMAMPAQALTYKIGQLKIMELRKKAETELGDLFDIKEFHRMILEPGCLPLNLLEKRVDDWIQDQQKDED